MRARYEPLRRERLDVRVLSAVFDDRFGGSAGRAIQVAQALKAHGVEMILCLPCGHGNAGDIAEEKGVPVRRVHFSPIPRLGKLGRLLPWLIKLPTDTRNFSRLFRDERTDLVQVSGAFFLPPAFASKLCRIPLVWLLNDTIIPRRIAPVFGKLVSRLADWILLDVEAAGEHYAVRKTRRSVVHPPVDIELFSPTQRQTRQQGGSIARVGMVANWTPVKGIEYFVKAAALVGNRLGGNIEIVMAGARLSTHEAYSREIEDLIRTQGLEGRFHDYGFVASVAPVLSRLDVLVLTSLSEACPMVILEAMASGVPVVATDVGGVREILSVDPERPAGLLVPPKDAEAIAEAVMDLLAHPSKAQALGINGRRIAKELFSIDLCVKRHMEVYELLTRAKLEKGQA